MNVYIYIYIYVEGATAIRTLQSNKEQRTQRPPRRHQAAEPD